MLFQQITPDNLDEFVQHSEALGIGSEACNHYWQPLTYRSALSIDQTLDPLSAGYAEQQMRLYSEISGKEYEKNSCELSVFDHEKAVNSPTPYSFFDPLTINKHFFCLSRFVDLLKKPAGTSFLELGSGWGFCCEHLARLGYNVTGIDINPQFIEMTTARSLLYKQQIRYFCSPFEEFSSEEKFDVIYSYEAFHHSIDPLFLLRKYSQLLSADGAFILVAEPFIDGCSWQWPHWGMRLDPFSIYCIRRYGWFEAGWTISYMKSLFRLAGLQAEYAAEPGSDLTRFLSGKRSSIFAASQFDLWRPENTGWHDEGTHLVSTGKSRLRFRCDPSVRNFRLHLKNYSPHPLTLHWQVNDLTTSTRLVPGNNIVTSIEWPLSGAAQVADIIFNGETWTPSKAIPGSIDNRKISFHLEYIEEVR